jgi:class 3 adenylate cyclase
MAGQVLVTDRVYAAVEDGIDARSLGPRLLKGFVAPVEIYDIRSIVAESCRVHAGQKG